MGHSKVFGLENKKVYISRYHTKINKTTLIISDIFFCILSAILVHGVSLLRGTKGFPIAASFDSHEGLERLIFLTLLLFTGIGWLWGKLSHYSYRKPFWSELKEIFQTVTFLALFDVAILAFSKHDFSRLEWLLLWLLVMILLPTGRSLTKLLLMKVGSWEIPTVIIGCGENALDAYQAIESETLMGYRIQAFILPSTSMDYSNLHFSIPLIEPLIFWQNYKGKVKVIIALESSQQEELNNWLRDLTSHGETNVSIIPSVRGIPLYGTEIAHFFSHEIMLLRLKNNLSRRSSRIIKRAFDLFIASFLLTLLSPFFGYLAFSIRRDGGPATYRHERIGYKGKPFKCLKFRSMVTNSQEVLEELLASDSQARTQWNNDFKLKKDPRITPIGKWLRRTSLDELPQLWNVFKGDMSLVGPRPIISKELERYKKDVEYYLSVKPGMTGLWQVSGRSNTDYQSRVSFDSWYVKNWSLWYDIAILFKTVKVVIKSDGAY